MLKKQLELIEISENENIAFGDVLSREGLTYDDLVYRNNKEKTIHNVVPMTLDDFYVPPKDIPIVSFFSGCGGLDLGFEASGYTHSMCFEINELFCKTLRKNKKWTVCGPPFFSGDVADFDETVSILEKDITRNYEGVFIGGPPCQPFSIASNQRFSKNDENFKRVGFSHKQNGNLLFNYINLIKYFKPKAFLIENVSGLKDIDGGKQLHEALEELTKCGYNSIEKFIFDASNFGVPQQRVRLIVIGSLKNSKIIPPQPLEYKVPCGVALQNVCKKTLMNTETRQHNAGSIKRYSELMYGQRDKLGRVDRLDPCLPSKTVIAGGTNGGGRSHLHPNIPRTLSVRECARLQTFPDDYVFVGPTARQFTQVGNAVPPILAAQIAQCMLKII